MEYYVPIYKIKGTEDEFFILSPDFKADTKEEAERISIGALVEMVIFNLEFVRIQQINIKNIPHIKAEIRNTEGACMRICVTAGPSFQEIKEYGQNNPEHQD